MALPSALVIMVRHEHAVSQFLLLSFLLHNEGKKLHSVELYLICLPSSRVLLLYRLCRMEMELWLSYLWSGSLLEQTYTGVLLITQSHCFLHTSLLSFVMSATHSLLSFTKMMCKPLDVTIL